MGMSTGFSGPSAGKLIRKSKSQQKPLASTAGPSVMRDINRSILLNLIRIHQPVSRARLAAMTGMFRSTVSDIVKDLLSSGFLVEAPGRPAGRGRVPVLLSLNDKGFEVVGISVRPERTDVALAGLSGTLGETVSFRTPARPDQMLSLMAEAIDKVRTQKRRSRLHTIDQIGVSLPGFVDAAAGRIRRLPHVPGYEDFALAAELEKRVGVLTAIDNDANLGALAEVFSEVVEQELIRDFIFIEIGTEGVGGGVILNGELYRGHDATVVAEFGHMIIEAGGIECSCGRRGCWEMYVSDHATLGRFAPLVGSTGARDQARFWDAVSKREPWAVECLGITAQYIAFGLTNIAFVLNPSEIVVAGHICSVWDLVYPVIESAFATTGLSTQVRKARLDADNLYLQGAILQALNRAFRQPTLGINSQNSSS